jgi:hypothetical protein
MLTSMFKDATTSADVVRCVPQLADIAEQSMGLPFESYRKIKHTVGYRCVDNLNHFSEGLTLMNFSNPCSNFKKNFYKLFIAQLRNNLDDEDELEDHNTVFVLNSVNKYILTILLIEKDIIPGKMSEVANDLGIKSVDWPVIYLPEYVDRGDNSCITYKILFATPLSLL